MEEMKDILKERSRDAIFSMEEGVITLAANHAINKGGDVRAGLECLLRAGRLAEHDNASKIKIDHIKKILKEVLKVKPQIIKENINEIERNILNILDEYNNLPFGELYNKYCERAENPITEKPFLNYVRHLDELKLLLLKKRKINGKRIVSKVK